MKNYVFKVNVFIDGERQYFSRLLYSICEGLNSFFSSKTQKKIMSDGKKETVSITILKNGLFANDFRAETEDRKVLSACCKYSSEVEYHDFMQETMPRNIKGSALKSICFLFCFRESVTCIH